MRRLIHLGMLGVALVSAHACTDDNAVPSVEWPPATHIAQDHFSSRCVVLRGELRCWASPQQSDVEITRDIIRVLYQRDEYHPGPPIPPVDFGPGADVLAFSAWTHQRCVVLATGALKCWGNNEFFQLGLPDPLAVIGDDDDERGQNMPSMPLGTGLHAEQVEAHGGGSCARFRDGRVKCWGLGGAGLGLGDTQTRGDDPGEMGDALPFVDLGDDVRVIQVSAAAEHTCALTDAGRVKCWGANSTTPDVDPPAPPEAFEPGSFGRLGTGDKDDRKPPLGDALSYVDLGEDFRAVAVVAREHSTCAVSDAGLLKCWGSGPFGDNAEFDDLGDEPGEMGDALPYVDVGAGRTIQKIDQEICMMLDDDTVKCWGPYNFGLLTDITHDELFGPD